MPGRTEMFLVLTVLVLVTFSCARLDDTPSSVKGEITTIEKLAHLDSIPSEWGGLVSVSSVPCYENWLQLWFQDGDGNIRMAPYNIKANQFSENVRLIRRRSGGAHDE